MVEETQLAAVWYRDRVTSGRITGHAMSQSWYEQINECRRDAILLDHRYILNNMCKRLFAAGIYPSCASRWMIPFVLSASFLHAVSQGAINRGHYLFLGQRALTCAFLLCTAFLPLLLMCTERCTANKAIDKHYRSLLLSERCRNQTQLIVVLNYSVSSEHDNHFLNISQIWGRIFKTFIMIKYLYTSKYAWEILFQYFFPKQNKYINRKLYFLSFCMSADVISNHKIGLCCLSLMACIFGTVCSAGCNLILLHILSLRNTFDSNLNWQ